MVSAELDAETPEAAMTRVMAAERALLAARDEARARYKAAGLETGGMFSEGTFVLRETAERWVREALAEQKKATTPAPPPEPKAEGWLADPGRRAWLERQNQPREQRSFNPVPPARPETEEQEIARLNAMSPEQKALAILNASRKAQGQPPLTRLPHKGPSQGD
jgi:regulator of protease activity HflC (stomatin/prohibitin superfamily)